MPIAPGNRLNTAFLVRLFNVLPIICPRVRYKSWLISFHYI